jgi:hypothetical protein
MISLRTILSVLVVYVTLTHEVRASTLPGRRNGAHLKPQKRQSQNQFNPSPDSGFDDPTVQIADPAFGTAIQAGYQGPMASDEDPGLVGPVNLLRNGQVHFGVTPNFTTPLYFGVSAKNSSYWYIVTDSSDEGESLHVAFRALLTGSHR